MTDPGAETPQKSGFVVGEADQWFARNREALSRDSVTRRMTVQRLAHWLPAQSTSRVLEIGCGQGDNLAELARLRPIEGHGIEPSRDAVTAGSALHPSLQLEVATADELPYGAGTFDVVWFGFCLYLIDRNLLQRAVAEADRVLKTSGWLVIVDFDPEAPVRRPYHHRPGLWSYKMDHSRLFLANPAYSLVEKASATHDSGTWSDDPQERVGLWICRKNLAGAYRPT